jgi:hypothetical protein
MGHWNLRVPCASGPVVRLAPGGTPVVWKTSADAAFRHGLEPEQDLGDGAAAERGHGPGLRGFTDELPKTLTGKICLIELGRGRA